MYSVLEADLHSRNLTIKPVFQMRKLGPKEFAQSYAAGKKTLPQSLTLTLKNIQPPIC